VRWRKTKGKWTIDPRRVEFGSLAKGADNLSRSHVLVHYSGEPRPVHVPLEEFFRTARAAVIKDRRLPIHLLRVAPITWRRHRSLFEKLTDWTPARQAARNPVRESHAVTGAAAADPPGIHHWAKWFRQQS